jgi:hypothetical protein
MQVGGEYSYRVDNYTYPSIISHLKRKVNPLVLNEVLRYTAVYKIKEDI